MISFQNLELTDIAVLKPFFAQCRTRACDNTVGGTFMWRDFFQTKYAVYNNTMAFQVQYFQNRIAFTMPLGADVAGMLREICAYAQANGMPVTICTATEPDIAVLQSLYEIEAVKEEDWSDYLYDAPRLAAMSGRKYNGQRNHMNHFRRDHSDYRFAPIGSDNLADVRAFFARYSQQTQKGTSIFEEEERKVYEVLAQYETYGQHGIALYTAGRVVAFSIGEVVGDTLFVHIEKADAAVTGAYQMIVSEFVRQNLEHGIAYVNREEDVGDAGLRASKQSYHPCGMIDKYTVTVKEEK